MTDPPKDVRSRCPGWPVEAPASGGNLESLLNEFQHSCLSYLQYLQRSDHLSLRFRWWLPLLSLSSGDPHPSNR